MSNQDLLREKAIQVSECCIAHRLPEPVYRLASEYSVDLIWRYEGKKHTLSLYYKPTRQRWTGDAKTDWLKNIVLPVIQPLFEQSQARIPPLSSVEQPESVQIPVLEVYFAEAIASLSVLTPFANENIDFSIICKQTREAVRMILSNQILSHIERVALSAILNVPDTTNFFEAKEYLKRCLILCNISNVVS